MYINTTRNQTEHHKLFTSTKEYTFAQQTRIKAHYACITTLKLSLWTMIILWGYIVVNANAIRIQIQTHIHISASFRGPSYWPWTFTTSSTSSKSTSFRTHSNIYPFLIKNKRKWKWNKKNRKQNNRIWKTWDNWIFFLNGKLLMFPQYSIHTSHYL